MIEKTLQKIAIQLEAITARGISITRALDLLEASTQSLEEILALNTMRESLEEMSLFNQKKYTQKLKMPLKNPTQPELLFGLA